ncbi:CHAT domain-containing protein [Spirulina sp. CS-785/01]|uniref:CHAT domain-containing protein n=1 Tax=Spirulina sp. CS-785/01 TaxID=3021716 RepID=UPI00232D6D10|nr:CHAT domain-containing protein [Spirulina sp. CS-785/01]MDB9312155.1 CHAT domain-containing protein [Spirulina sp. CS-785/01]
MMKKILFLTLISCAIVSRASLPKTAFASESEFIIAQNSSPVVETLLVSEAQRLYEMGQYDEAILTLQRTLEQEQTENDVMGAAIALRNLALIYGKMGQVSPAQQVLTESRSLTQQQAQTAEQQHLLAQIFEVEGQLHLSRGQPKKAAESWQQAGEIYQQENDTMGMARAKIGQAQALQAMGMHKQASERLEALNEQLAAQPDTLLKSQALQLLGDVQRALGRIGEAQQALEKGLQISQTLQNPEQIASIQISLGNTARISKANETQDVSLQASLQTALTHYRQAVLTAPNLTLKLQAQLNELRVLAEQKDIATLKRRVPTLEQTITQLPANRAAIYAQLNFTQTLMQLEESVLPPAKMAQQLAQALDQAKMIGDERAKARIWVSLGRLYEQHQRYGEAQTATEKGILVAQTLNAPEIAYQGQWQLGRILRQQEERESAIAAYGKAVTTLQSLRSDLVAINPDLQFSFRESVEPVYRQYVDLLLQPNATQSHLKAARKAIEALQLAELDNFFRDACSDVQEQQIDQIDPESAIFYTIILENRLETILALPGQPLRNYTTPLSKQDIEQALSQMRYHIATPQGRLQNRKRLEVSQTIYNWLITPIEPQLNANGATNLVFVLDGSLRNIPLPALHDGEQYLIEKYSLALAPSLNLINPKPLERETVAVLGGGITQAVQGFSALPNVRQEIEKIQQQVPAAILLNDSFVEQQFNTQVNTQPFPIVHLATHGQFSSQAEETFILTWDDQLNIDELNALLRADTQQLTPIELLILSACQTATGDDRAALGLAGMAVRAGARSTIASLWLAADEPTSNLMGDLYKNLSNPDTTKAKALQEAQLSILNGEDGRFRHPFYWSGFVLVGNWL